MITAVPSDTIEDPRVARTRQAVIDAAVALLMEGGPTAVTIDAIVTRSKVAKSTIYRHWDTRDDVLIDVLHSCGPQLPEVTVEGPTADALREVLYGVVEMTNDPMTSRVISTLIMLRLEMEGAEDIEKRLEKEQNDTVLRILEHGVEQGTIKPGFDAEQAAAHLFGPMFYAHLTGALPPDKVLADQTVEVFLAAYGT